MTDTDVPDSTDWLSTPLNALAAVEASLRCQVCKDFYRTPMLTSCSHTFCSLCIRRALSNDGKCPLCRAGEQELKLRSNWSMEETVEAFMKARPDVLKEARRRETSPKRKANATDGLSREEDAPANKRVRTSARLSKSRAEARASQPVEEEEEIFEVPDDNEADETYTPENNDGLVPCPVCNNKMKEWQVFKHLESCTGPPSPNTNNNHTSSGPSSFSTPFRKPSTTTFDRLPAINYSMLKETALRRKLSELGISTTGTRALLEKRHKEWITLWNANCDAAKPKKRRELLKDLEVWEKTQGGGGGSAGRGGGVMVKDKEFDGRAWGSKHGNEFRELIESARKSRAKAAAGETKDKVDEEQQAEVEKPQDDAARTDVIQEVPSSSPLDEDDAFERQTAEEMDMQVSLRDLAAIKRKRRGSNDWENIIPIG